MCEEKKTPNITVHVLITILCTLIITSAASAGYIIGDYVWYDLNGDGIQGADEPGVEGVTVKVYDCLGNPIEPLITSVDTTNEAGWYRIVLATWPPPEPFYLEFVMPDDFAYNFTLQDQGNDDILDSDVDPNGMIPCFTWPDNNLREIYDLDAGIVEKKEECGDCIGQVTQLTLQYNGTVSVTVKVIQKGFDVLFEDYVIPGSQFTIYGTGKNGTLDNDIFIYVNNKYSTEIHTSCSEPIGPGLISGDFEVIEGYSKDGGLLCPIESSEDCDCEGYVTQLTLQYIGTSEEPITVTQKDWRKQLVIFSEDGINDIVTTEGVFTINGFDKYGTFGNEISIYIGQTLNTKIITNCLEPIGPGLISGDFLVIEGYSQGGTLCPVQSSEDCQCDGNVTELKLKYKGKSRQPVVIIQGKDDEPIFADYIYPDDVFTVKGNDKEGTLGQEISIYVGEDMNLHTRIDTSCSKPIGPGLIYGDFEVIEGYSLKGGPLRSYGTD